MTTTQPQPALTLGSKEFWERLALDPAALAAEICSIDIRNIDETLQRQPALRAWVNATHEGARIEEERAKYELTKATALATVRLKGDVDPVTKKPKTVGVLEAEVVSDKNVMERQELLLAAMQKRGILRAMSDALEDRLQMLIQIAAKQRKELEDSGRS